MALSSSADLTFTGADVIKGALRALGILESGETPTSDEVADGLEALNLLCKQYMSPNNFMSPGLKLWKRKHLTLALSSTNEYTLKLRKIAFTSGGTYVLAVGDTITGGTGGATAVVMNIELTSGTFAGEDAAGTIFVESQVGTFESETLNVGDNSNVATITADTETYGPITEFLEVVRRDSDGFDSPMREMTLPEWMALSDKDTSGTPNRFYSERRIDEVKFYLNCTPSDTTDTVFMVVLLPFEDFDASTDTVDTPVEWYRALKFNLALEIAPEFNVEPSNILVERAVQSLLSAQTFAPENTVMYFEPDRDDD